MPPKAPTTSPDSRLRLYERIAHLAGAAGDYQIALLARDAIGADRAFRYSQAKWAAYHKARAAGLFELADLLRVGVTSSRLPEYPDLELAANQMKDLADIAMSFIPD